MKKLLLIALLLIFVLVSGCVAVQKKESEKEAPELENKTPVVEQQKNISENISKEVTQTLKLENELYVGNGRASAIAEYNGNLYIAYQRYAGSTDDVYYATYNGGRISSAINAVTGAVNEINPSLTEFKGKLYLFYTKVGIGSTGYSSNIYFKSYNGSAWNSENKANDFVDIWYPHNQTGVAYDGKLLLFWMKGRPNERGAIGTQYFDGGFWLDAIKVSVENVNEKNGKVFAEDKTIYMIYEGFAGNAESSQIYARTYNGNAWSGAEKISGDIQTAFKSTGGIVKYNDKIYAIWTAGDSIYASIKIGNAWGTPIKLLTGNVDEPTIAEYDGKLYMSYTRIKESGASFVYLAELKV